MALVALAAAHGGTSWAGVLAAVWGTGSLAGGLAYGSQDWRSRVEDRAMACAAFFAVLLMLLAAAPGLIMLALLMIPLGVPLSPWLGSLSASVQHAVPAAASTEAFAWTFTVITAGSACGGLIIQTASTQAAFLAPADPAGGRRVPPPRPPSSAIRPQAVNKFRHRVGRHGPLLARRGAGAMMASAGALQARPGLQAPGQILR
jgi:hypothetical protein